MVSVTELVRAMQDTAPAGLVRLEDAAVQELHRLTTALMSASPAAVEEYARFLSIRQRCLPATDTNVAAWARGKTVLVTGGTGCIGSTLIVQIAEAGPRRLVSLSRGLTGNGPPLAGAEYVQADLRDSTGLAAAFAEIRPDVVFHLGAQREPGLAEAEVHRTVTTNIFGTRNVIAAAEQCGVAQVVIASTGKALRPYTPDVYCASKRVVEWLAARAAAHAQTRYSAARFTHVVDNSIVHARLFYWREGGVVRLHAPDIGFYAQSALESAQLLLAAGLGATPGTFRVHAIADLGWPISLLDLALGVLIRTGSTAPIYFSGYDPGYESTSFPGLYDPVTAGDVSPLISAFEAPFTERDAFSGVDAFPVRLTPNVGREELLEKLESVCDSTQEPSAIRCALNALSWSLLEGSIEAVPHEVLASAARRAARHRDRLNAEQKRLLVIIESYASRGR
jgi:nucleoside-diphosphate-sugar epimerase